MNKMALLRNRIRKEDKTVIKILAKELNINIEAMKKPIPIGNILDNEKIVRFRVNNGDEVWLAADDADIGDDYFGIPVFRFSDWEKLRKILVEA